MTREEVAGRIDELIRISRKNNKEIGEAVGVGKETVRQWREAMIWPRMDKIDVLARTLRSTPEFLLLGLQSEKRGVDTLRERICQSDTELKLLRLFRATNREGKTLIIESAKSYCITHPAPHNVIPLQKRQPR